MSNTQTATADPQLIQRVRKALEGIRPFLVADGGDVDLVDIVEGVAKVELKGHCAGCPMSTQTLRLGIEKHLKERVPEIVSVEQTRSQEPVALPVNQIPAPEIPASERRATHFLRAEHTQLKAVLKELDAALVSLVAGGVNNGRRELQAVRRVRHYLAHEFMDHMRIEEKILFPALRPLISWGEPTVALQKEHENLRAAIKRLGDAIAVYELGGVTNLPGIASQLGAMLREHVFREENTLYFEADESLPDDVVKKLQDSARCLSAAS
jgi:Fe-S cluster biogenesis protein NfuA/hemerythrin-like domain-containing protein